MPEIAICPNLLYEVESDVIIMVENRTNGETEHNINLHLRSIDYCKHCDQIDTDAALRSPEKEKKEDCRQNITTDLHA